MKKHKKFTAKERELLSNWLASGVTKSECARRLKRPRRTVIREVNRNSCLLENQSGQREFVYVAISAQAKAEVRQTKSAHNKSELKNPQIYEYVTSHLRRGWSPEQISGRLREVVHPGERDWQIRPETIYQWIYKQPKNETGKCWFEYLRRKQKKRKKQTGRAVHRGNIPDRVSISKRPEEANNRTEFGHWEGDSIEGKRKSTGAGLHTEVERMSRLIKATKVKRLTSSQAYSAQRRLFESEPTLAIKSTTLDNGKETHQHYKLRKKFNMMTYHAHPYSSFERGTNEHGNWHLRYYFPKGTDFAQVTQTELQAVVDEINNRPRKIHHFLSAKEVYYQLLKNTKV